MNFVVLFISPMPWATMFEKTDCKIVQGTFAILRSLSTSKIKVKFPLRKLESFLSFFLRVYFSKLCSYIISPMLRVNIECYHKAQQCLITIITEEKLIVKRPGGQKVLVGESYGAHKLVA